MTTTKWFFEADYVQACNCEYGCPCEFQAPPSHGFCEGVGAWRINNGKFGDVPLNGLGLAFVAHWPKAIHLGNGTAALFFDAAAAPAQRDALLQIATGQAGGIPFEILVTTVTKFLEPQFAPFTFNIEGRTSSVKVGNAVQIGLAPNQKPGHRRAGGSPRGARDRLHVSIR